jgi:hypothetical protein
LFLDDLAEYLEGAVSDEKFLSPNDLSDSENELRFSYQFPDHLKLNQIDAFKSDFISHNKSSKETCNIKRAIDMDEENKKWISPELQSNTHSTQNLEAFLQKEGYLKNNSNKSSNRASPLQLISLLPRNSELVEDGDGEIGNLVDHPEETDETMYEEKVCKEDEAENKFKRQFENDSKYPSTFIILTRYRKIQLTCNSKSPKIPKENR